MAGETRYVGRSLRRREDGRFLRGKARYLDDIRLSGVLHVAFVRSPHAHARVRDIRMDGIREVPGVKAWATGASLKGRILPIRAEMAGKEGQGQYQATEWYALATDRVRFVGEAVAAVVGASRYAAEDGCDRVEVDYEPLPVVSDMTSALAADAIALHDGRPDNVLYRYTHRTSGVDDVFANAPVRIRGRVRTPRCTGAPMETRGVIADYDASRDFLTVWSSTQTPHILRTALARFLQMPEHRLRVVTPDVGGAFGVKMQVFPEDLVCAYLSRELGRPVKWVEDRRESLLASTHARDGLVDGEIAADRDGRVLGIRASIQVDVGAYSTYPLTAALEPLGAGQTLCGPYALGEIAFETVGVATNKCPVGAYRGVGQVIGTFARERLLDMLAHHLSLDPAEVRRRNYVSPEEHPYRTPVGLVYDSGRYGDVLEKVLEEGDYGRWRQYQRSMRDQGRYVGIGLASYIEYTGMGPATFRRRGMVHIPGHDAASVRIEPGGKARVAVSATSQGQGHDTALCQLVADELGLPLDDVALIQGDTDVCPYGSGTFASRSLVASGGAAWRAARRVREKAEQVAAQLLEAAPEDVVTVRGGFHLRGTPTRRISWAEVADWAYAPGPTPAGDMIQPGLEATDYYNPPPAAFANGTHLAVVEVDAETGVIHILRYVVGEDCGVVVNPLIVEGQALGAVAQGIGNALYEHMTYSDNGQALTASFMDYLIPTAAEVPRIDVRHVVTPSPYTEGGVKGMAEGGTVCAPAAIANAVADALRPFSAEVLDLPLSPDRIRQLITEAGSSAADLRS